MAFNPNGTRRWYVSVHNPSAPYVSGIVASLAVGHWQGTTAVVAPSIGEEQDAIGAGSGQVLAGFPWFQADGDYATPALADLYGNGVTQIVEGGGQTPGNAYDVQYPRGGHIRVEAVTGNAGTHNPAGGLRCNFNPGQSVDSSPAVGRFLAGDREGIVAGTGDFWPHAPGTDELFALDARCKLAWSARLDGLTTSSPALADLYGNGLLDVVEGTNNTHGGGSVYALSGASGAVLWRQASPGEMIGSVVTADLGGGHQDVIVAGTGGAEVLDGRTGQVLAVLGKYVGFQNSALVTDDPDGEIGVTVAGYDAHDVGVVEHFELSGSRGSDAYQAGGWPMFHHDPQLSGNAEAPL
jgi:outer membrane protein assembly factor BamB